MVILIVDQDGILVRETEGESPTLVHPDSPVTGQVAGQAVKPSAGQVRFFCAVDLTQSGELSPQPGGMSWLDAAFVAGTEETLKPFVPE